MSKKMVFNEKWCDAALHPEFIPWLTGVKANKYQAYCKACLKPFELSNMGIRAVSSHARGSTHIINLKSMMTQRTVESVFSKTKGDAAVDETQLPAVEKDVGIAAKKPVQVNNMVNYVLKDDVAKAECIWSMEVVAKRISFNSCKDIAPVLKCMFPDSNIAKQFQLGSTKVAYTVSYGLAPHFHHDLMTKVKSCEDYVICFDESLNKVVQRGQMDQVVRFWDVNRNKVSTRYLNSVFLGKATADDLLEKFYEGMAELPTCKLLQVSMDGPNVNHSFLKKLMCDIEMDDKGKKLLDLGTCGLHVVHGAFKTGLSAAEWNLNSLLRHFYYLFKDYPSRRAAYTCMTGSVMFPLKFCATRWVENVKCLERAIDVFDMVKTFVNNTKIANSIPLAFVKKATQDPLMKCKLSFFKTIASECEPFLKKFQSTKPMVPYLHEELHQLFRCLMSRFVKSEKLLEASKAEKLMALDITVSENLARRNIDIGFAAAKHLREAKASELEKANFQYECRKLLSAMIKKLAERSPLKYRLVLGLSCLDPSIIVHSPQLGKSRMNTVLEALHNSNRISETLAENAKRQYCALLAATKTEFKQQFSHLELVVDSGLDTFYASILDATIAYKDLWEVIKLCLILSHGQAAVEGGFSINKSLLIENLHEETVVSQRRVYDGILEAGGVLSVPIDGKLLNSVRSAHSRYQQQLELKRQMIRDEDKKVREKKELDKKIKRLEETKKRVQKDAQLEQEALDQEVRQLEIKKKKLM